MTRERRDELMVILIGLLSWALTWRLLGLW